MVQADGRRVHGSRRQHGRRSRDWVLNDHVLRNQRQPGRSSILPGDSQDPPLIPLLDRREPPDLHFLRLWPEISEVQMIREVFSNRWIPVDGCPRDARVGVPLHRGEDIQLTTSNDEPRGQVLKVRIIRRGDDLDADYGIIRLLGCLVSAWPILNESDEAGGRAEKRTLCQDLVASKLQDGFREADPGELQGDLTKEELERVDGPEAEIVVHHDECRRLTFLADEVDVARVENCEQSGEARSTGVRQDTSIALREALPAVPIDEGPQFALKEILDLGQGHVVRDPCGWLNGKCAVLRCDIRNTGARDLP